MYTNNFILNVYFTFIIFILRVKFVKEFNLLPAAQRVGRRSEKVQKKEQNVVVTYDRPFEPNWIYKMLNGMQSDSFVVEGRQEDAEEFLGCLLNGLNDEMLEVISGIDIFYCVY